MRLTRKMIKVIVDKAKSIVGDDAAIWVFGSRVNDELRGGDIDLLIEVNRKLENRVASACQIAAKIQMVLGEQRLDILVKDSDTVNLPIHDVAKKQGIKLC